MATRKEKVVKKIHGLMTKWGVTPDELEEFGKDLDVELEDTDFEDDQIEETVEGGNELENKEPETDNEAETEGEEIVEKETKELEMPNEVPAGQEQPEEPAEQVEPAEPAQPTATPEQVAELHAAVEGLRAKLDSLYDSLSKAGVLMVEETPVGVDSSTAPANGEEETFDDVLDTLNKGRKY